MNLVDPLGDFFLLVHVELGTEVFSAHLTPRGDVGAPRDVVSAMSSQKQRYVFS